MSLDDELLAAAKAGKTDECMRLIDAGANVDAQNGPEDGMQTPLLLAMLSRRTDTALAIIERGARLDLHDQRGWYPIHRAAHEGLDEACSALHAKGADLNILTVREKLAPLALAANNTYSSTFILLLDLGADPTLAVTSDKKNLLHLAIECDPEVLDHPRLRSLDVNALFNYGMTPLHLAGEKGSVPHALRLLEMGADHEIGTVLPHDEPGYNAAQVAEYDKHPDTAAAIRAWIAQKAAQDALKSMIGLQP